MKRLLRSKKNRMIAGVAGGFSEYFNIDASIIRLILVLMLLAGPGLFFYIIAWIIIPEE